MITKVSEITYIDIANYLRIAELDETDVHLLKSYIEISKSYIENYTGISRDMSKSENLDSYSDFVIVIFVLCQDMYDNRTLYCDGKSINNTVKTILDMHTRNNIG